MSFTSAITTTDEEAVDTLFGTKTPGADNLLGGKKKEGADEGENQDPANPKGATTVQEAGAAQEKVNALSADQVVDDLFGKDEEGEEGADKNAAPKAKPAPAAKKEKTEFEVNYQALYEQMVSDGVWEEVELPENVEWNADTFKKVQLSQTSAQYKDLLDKTGPYGKAIIEYEKNGGNPGELLNLFREQRQVQEFDIANPEGQEEFMRAYYMAQGNSEKSIDRKIKALQDQGPEVFEEEAKENKSLWDVQYEKEIENIQKEQLVQARELQESARKHQRLIQDTLIADTEVTPKERKDLASYMLEYNQEYHGKQVSQFYVDMSEIQKDPVNYVELAKFIKGVKTGEYKKKVETKAKREVTAATFMKVKKGNALAGTAGGSPDINDGDSPSFVTFLKGGKQ